MRGDIYKHKDDKHSDMDLMFKADDGHVSYVPKAHVQFLEQAGIRVVPVDYRLPAEERFEMYDQLNGLYITGDSQMAVTDQVFKDAFASTLWYLEDATFEEGPLPRFYDGKLPPDPYSCQVNWKRSSLKYERQETLHATIKNGEPPR